MRAKEIVDDLKYYLAQFENAEKTAKEENMDVDAVIDNLKASLMDFAKNW